MTWNLIFPQAGEYRLDCELRSRDGKTLATDQIPLAVLASPASGTAVVGMDERGRLLVDGKKFFPIGIFTNRQITRKQLELPREMELIAEAGFNCVLPYDSLEYRMPGDNSADKEEALGKVLDHLQTLNLKMLPSLDYVRKGEHARMQRVVTNLRNHPALLGWYLCDEPTLKERDSLRKLCRELNQLDPAHPLIGVSLMADGSALYAGTTNIYAFDTPFTVTPGTSPALMIR